MSLQFRDGGWQRMCPGCGARGCRCKWEQGALYLSCRECDSEFCFIPKVRSEGRGVWVRRLADPSSIHHSGGHEDASQSRGGGAGVCGTEKSGGESVPIGGSLCEGPRSGGASIGDSGRSDALDRSLQASRGQASESLDRSAEIRTDRTGLLRPIWIGSFEITAEGGRPVDLTIILVAVLLLAFLTGLGVGRL
ncbi:conserved hypothetical protein [Nitrospira defluvii]|uniref:Uncharacterized protein n=1 Tax=Nitrospira defluvii TaxID=330214 RepID=A0ABM8RHV4_9BACT|nr:conserved hypothetical protein [Nitrospira defluvii]